MRSAIILSLFLFLGLQGFGQNQPFQSASHSKIKFVEEMYDFGDKPLGSEVSHKFDFQNISKERIAIREVKVSCGCTTPSYSTEPIKPGRKGSITAKYDSKRPGQFIKTMTVLVSDGEEIVLTIKGNITSPTEKAALPR
jgi:hypothetical protein